MFCPKCKSEYREGFTRCNDCDVDLVWELAEKPMNERRAEPGYVAYQPVLTTFNSGDISFIKSLLDCEDINYYFQGENFNLVRSGVQPAVLMVQEDHAGKAEAILKDVDLSYLLLPTGSDGDDSE